MSEYTGKAGTIYVRLQENPNAGYEVWYEDFCELGTGPTEVEALQDAFRNAGEIVLLISEATIKASDIV